MHTSFEVIAPHLMHSSISPFCSNPFNACFNSRKEFNAEYLLPGSSSSILLIVSLKMFLFA
ncbi:MAG TPA: hypothetical protein VJK05_00045 [archaeon]|nr:hypothetical protein [archaeon]